MWRIETKPAKHAQFPTKKKVLMTMKCLRTIRQLPVIWAQSHIRTMLFAKDRHQLVAPIARVLSKQTHHMTIINSIKTQAHTHSFTRYRKHIYCRVWNIALCIWRKKKTNHKLELYLRQNRQSGSNLKPQQIKKTNLSWSAPSYVRPYVAVTCWVVCGWCVVEIAFYIYISILV